jgi:hypothetical protein
MGMFHLIFEIFKALVRETEMNRLNKMSLIGTFVLFFKYFVSIEYNFYFFV